MRTSILGTSCVDENLGRDYQSYALTRADQEVEIGGKPNIVAKANLSSLGFYIRIRRMKGDFPRIYVVDIPAG